MADDLATPIAPAKSRQRFVVPIAVPRAVAGVLGSIVGVFVLWALVVDDPFGGEPVAVISVGARNSYGHPSMRVIQQWQSVGARVRRTDHEGTILVVAHRDGTFVDTAERLDTVEPDLTPLLGGIGSAFWRMDACSLSTACCPGKLRLSKERDSWAYSSVVRSSADPH